jgi:UDP-N-acetylmuramoyl-tripeptide--D-alanyl-D-alanine ligase
VIVKPQSTADGVTFELWHDETMLKLRSSLFGSVNIKNMALAASLCWSMGISPELIARRIRLASGASHRLALSKTEKGVLIDNTYSSNIAGFEAVMEDLGRLPGTKGLITSGLVELGTETARYHQALGGKAATVFDEVVLAGRTPRTLAFKKGLIKAGFKGTVIEIEAEIVGMTAAAERMGKQYPWVLWENDLPNHYF